MAYHMLNTRVAKQCGVNAALIFHYLHFWIEKNRANGKHFHDGRYWTYCSMDGFRRILDYLSPKQIRTAIEKLEREGYIVKGSYNKSSYDRTTWYAVTESGYGLLRDNETANPVAVSENSVCPDGQMETPESANQSADEGNSIEETVIITDRVTDIIPPNPPEGEMGGIPAEPEPVPEAKPAKGRKKAAGQRAFPSAPFFPENPVLEKAMADWLAYKRERREPPKTASGMKKLVARMRENAERYGAETVAAVIDESISNDYQGIVWSKIPQKAKELARNASQDCPSWAELAEEVERGVGL